MKIISGKKVFDEYVVGNAKVELHTEWEAAKSEIKTLVGCQLLFDFLDMGQKSAGEKIAAVREGKIAPRAVFHMKKVINLQCVDLRQHSWVTSI